VVALDARYGQGRCDGLKSELLERPDRGEVWVGGERIDSLTSNESALWRRCTLGYLSQHSTLVDFLSAKENVELALTMRGFSRADATQRAERWLDWVGLGKLVGRRADRLSGGEQRRVGALGSRPATYASYPGLAARQRPHKGPVRRRPTSSAY
jgi:predicted ABC-type transport system involved in lysophospholipase L1 biosynthesis ATPase subunit